MMKGKFTTQEFHTAPVTGYVLGTTRASMFSESAGHETALTQGTHLHALRALELLVQ
jgi:hypothetical protein